MTLPPPATRATSLAEVSQFLDGKLPLAYGEPGWDQFYTDTKRRDIDILIRTFVRRGLGHKALFGGHSGNGKTTELSRFKGSDEIQQHFFVIAADVADSLNPVDLEIVELLLLVIVETLAYADTHQLRLDHHLFERFKKLEGAFKGSLVIEQQQQEKVQSSLEASGEASLGYPGFLVKLRLKLLAKIKAQSDYRETVRTTFRPELNQLVELLDDLLLTLCLNDPHKRKPLIVLDGLDRMSFESSLKLYVQDASTLALIRQASLLLTVPISIIHSPDSAMVSNHLGKIHVFKNLRLQTREGGLDDDARDNHKLLVEFVHKRLEPSLISEQALKTAIHYSGRIARGQASLRLS